MTRGQKISQPWFLINAISKPKIDNDVDRCSYIFMDDQYAEVIRIATYKVNRKGFLSDWLLMDKGKK